jgi:uncharacterized membrane protein YcaP (DUF421 family)
MLILFVRTITLYLLVLIVMRLMGKRQIGQLQPFELVVTILIADLVAIPMQDRGFALINGVIPVLTLLIAQTTISYLALKSKKLRSIICGKPTIMVENGKIKWESFRENLYNLDDLQEQLRTKGFFDLQDVEFALLETNGSLSVLPKADRRPLTPADMKIDPGYEGLSLPLIQDGEVQEENLAKAALDREWLASELAKFGVTDFSRVIIASLDSNGRLLYQVKPEPVGNDGGAEHTEHTS